MIPDVKYIVGIRQRRQKVIAHLNIVLIFLPDQVEEVGKICCYGHSCVNRPLEVRPRCLGPIEDRPT